MTNQKPVGYTRQILKLNSLTSKELDKELSAAKVKGRSTAKTKVEKIELLMVNVYGYPAGYKGIGYTGDFGEPSFNSPEVKPTITPETETTAPAKVERVRVKLYFDINNICLGGCCDDCWLPLYTGEEYVASEFFKLTPGFNPVGKTVKELQQIEQDSNPYKIAATATAVALEAKLTAEKAAYIAEVESNGLEAKAEATRAAEIVATAKAQKTARSVAAIEAMGLDVQEANHLAEAAKKYPALAKIKIDYPNLDISELEAAFNNDEILEIKQIQKGAIPIFLVLRVWGKNEWVTHHYNAANNGFSLGWYFKDLQKAQDNYRKRKRGECSPLGPVTR
jgi:hypothetical protein